MLLYLLRRIKFVLFDLESVLFIMENVLFGMESVRCGLESVLFEMESVLFGLESVLIKVEIVNNFCKSTTLYSLLSFTIEHCTIQCAQHSIADEPDYELLVDTFP
jgi:hypothetical protein